MTQPQPPSSRPQPLVLASSSPRRRELLAEAGYEFTVVPPPPEIECGVCSELGPAGLVAELAFRKAQAVVGLLQDEENNRGRGRPSSLVPVVVAADTVAECDGFILGKPHDEEDARAMLRQLSGREHRVLTGLCLWRLGDRGALVQVARTTLQVDTILGAQVYVYLWCCRVE